MRPDQADLHEGIVNMLAACGGCVPGETVLIVHEGDVDTFYDPGLAAAVENVARAMGLIPTVRHVPFRPEVEALEPELESAVQAADCTIFLARLGDQIRFRPNRSSGRQVISYALDRAQMASAFGRMPHATMAALKRLVDEAVFGAQEIRVTCPEGTDFRGTPGPKAGEGGEVTLRRFPLSIFTPVPAAGFSGRIAQVGFLTGTGSRYYTPYGCALAAPVLLRFEGNRLPGFEGAATDVAAAEAHYDFVGGRFGIDARHVHSWHAGIHPGCAYDLPAAANFERWSGGAFGNPRVLHFHTRGDYPPGEISVNLLDPTVLIDGVPVWEDGRLHPGRLSGGAALLQDCPLLAEVFAHPAQAVGAGPDGRLSGVA